MKLISSKNRLRAMDSQQMTPNEYTSALPV
jgi:hypothetical protein